MFLKYKKEAYKHTHTYIYACRLYPSFGAPFMRIEDHKKYSKKIRKKIRRKFNLYVHAFGGIMDWKCFYIQNIDV